MGTRSTGAGSDCGHSLQYMMITGVALSLPAVTLYFVKLMDFEAFLGMGNYKRGRSCKINSRG
jgi:hypothetical protein